MKKVALALSLALVLAAPSFASGLGANISMWDTDEADDDQGFGIKLEFDAGERVDFEIRASGYDGLTRIGSGALFRIEAFPLDMGFAYSFPLGGKVEPFVGGGGSYYFLNADYDGGAFPAAGQVEMDEEFGIYAVAGLEAAMSSLWGFYAEVMLRSVEAKVEGDDFGFVDIPVDLTGVSGAIGVILTW